MSQVFSGDSVNGGSVTVTTTTLTTAVTGNFLNPPFGNAKAIVWATANLTVGAGTTIVNLRLFRNPQGENVSLQPTAQSVGVAAGGAVQLSLQACDVIPDGRAVQYSMAITQIGATGNGTINFSNISAIMISG